MNSTLALYLREFINILVLPVAYHMGRPLIRPTVFAIYLTKKCNSRCQMCDFWRSHESEDEMTFDEVIRILDQLWDYGVKTVSFSAEGEIFTRLDAVEILRYANAKGFIFGVNSNGLAIGPELAKELAEIKPNSIILSIDTADPIKYGKIRGVKGGLDKITLAIKNLQANGYTKISAGAVISNYNVDELQELLNYAKALKLHSFRFTALQRHGFAKDWSSEEWQHLSDEKFISLLEEEINNTIGDISNNRILANTIPYLKMIPEYYRAKHYYPIPCVEGYYKGKIMPNGDLSLCPIIGRKAVIGNLKDDALPKLWKSSAASDVRSKIKNRQCPGCWLSCYGEDNLRFSLKYSIIANIKALRRATRLL